jgi:hypothetical protein
VLAVDGGCADTDNRRRAQRRLIDLGTSERPQRQWRNACGVMAQIDTVERCERQRRPLLRVGGDQSAAKPVDAVEIFCGAVDVAPCLGVTGELGADRTAKHTLRSLHRADPGRQGRKLGARRLGHPREVRPRSSLAAHRSAPV